MPGWGVKGGEELRAIAAELRRVGDGREIRKRFRRELTAAAAPGVAAAKQAALAIPVKGTSGSTGLRKALARSVRLRIHMAGRSASVSILADPRRMPQGEKALPKDMEGLQRWRHPVFGNREAWVTQQPHPWFFPALDRGTGPRSVIAAQRVVSSITRDITLGK